MKKTDRNLKPHAEAIVATCMWGDEYAPQRLGCMDWYDTLSDGRKRLCRQLLDDLKDRPREKVAKD